MTVADGTIYTLLHKAKKGWVLKDDRMFVSITTLSLVCHARSANLLAATHDYSTCSWLSMHKLRQQDSVVVICDCLAIKPFDNLIYLCSSAQPGCQAKGRMGALSILLYLLSNRQHASLLRTLMKFLCKGIYWQGWVAWTRSWNPSRCQKRKKLPWCCQQAPKFTCDILRAGL